LINALIFIYEEDLSSHIAAQAQVRENGIYVRNVPLISCGHLWMEERDLKAVLSVQIIWSLLELIVSLD